VTTSFWILLAPLFVAALVTLRAALRDRDPRHAGSLGFIALLAARHFVSPPAALPSLDAALEAEATPLLLALAVNLGAWLAASLTASSIHERNRAEELQWSSMEALRELAERLQASSSQSNSPSQERAHEIAQHLLAFGCEHLRFETGLLLERTASSIEILAAETPADVQDLEPGPCPALADSLAARCFESREVVTVDRPSLMSDASDSTESPFGWESLAGLRILASDDGALSIVFADRAPRATRLGAVEKSLLTVMGRWLEERADAASLRALLEAQPVPPAAIEAAQVLADTAADTDAGTRSATETDKPLTPTLSRSVAATRGAASEEPAPDGVDLNREIRSIEARLRKSVGGTYNLRVTLAPKTPRIEFEAGALERVATSLLLHAADTLPDDGDLDLLTGAIEAPEPGIPGFGTLTVKTRGPALDTGQLGAVYEGRGDMDLHLAKRRLPLTRVVRLLRDAGGDLSLESEEGVGTTLTAFLPACLQTEADETK
jgi:hypothetical protein